ncbi:uncharacterized protein LOC143532863 [Bidens hawaiensis]|uniref:uncharacterized protein LOC143532863 n=1 Tax=Bidens hawaiensis TaxID=980011 RepID=UPI00404AE575
MHVVKGILKRKTIQDKVDEKQKVVSLVNPRKIVGVNNELKKNDSKQVELVKPIRKSVKFDVAAVEAKLIKESKATLTFRQFQKIDQHALKKKVKDNKIPIEELPTWKPKIFSSSRTIYGDKWIIDSRCSRHITSNLNLLNQVKDIQGGYIEFTGKNGGKITKEGQVSNGKITFERVNLCEKVDHRQLSVSQICDKNYLFYIKGSREQNDPLAQKDGSQSHKKDESLNGNDLVDGVSLNHFHMTNYRVSSNKGKQKKKYHPLKQINSIDTPVERLHMDLLGRVNRVSIGGNLYCLVVTDDYSRYSCDICTELENSIIEFFCIQRGIHHEYSAPSVPQQNGFTERKNQTIIEVARTMLAGFKLHVQFWNEAVNTACYTLSRVLTIKKFKKTSYELLNNRKPNLQFLEPFTCPFTMLKRDARKFEEKAIEGYILGYASPKKCVFNLSSGCVEEWYHVDCQRYTTTPAGKGPDWMFDYDGLFNSFTPSVEVQNEDLVHAYQENELLFSPSSSTSSSSSVSVQPDILDVLYDTSDDANFKDSTLEQLVETHEDNEVIQAESSIPITEQVVDEIQRVPNGRKECFLNSVIHEEVYVKHPPGFEDPDFPERVYQLNKDIYGLNQAPRSCYSTLAGHLLEI